MSSAKEQESEMDSSKVPFEEALNKAGFGLYSYGLTCLTGLSIISFACIVYSSTIVVPTSACELGTTLAQQGLLVAAPLIGTIIGAIMWGYLADTRGRKSMLLTSFLSGALINAIASISVNWVMLMVFQFTASLLASGQYSLPMTILSESVPMARRSFVVLLVTSIFLLAQGVMAVMAMPIIPLSFSHHVPGLDIYWNSWRLLMLVYCVPSLVSALWLAFMHESPKYVFAKGNEDEALEILRQIHRSNHRRSKEELQVKSLQPEMALNPASKPSAKDQIVPLFKMPLLKYTIIMTMLSMFLQVGSFMVWLPRIANQFVEILREGENTDLSLCGIIGASLGVEADTTCSLNVTALLIVFAVGAIQSLVNGLLSLVINQAGRRNTVMVITAVCGASGVVLNFVPSAVGSAVLFVVFLVGLLVLGLYTAISVALFPTHLRALAVSLTMTGGRITSFGVVQLLNYLLANNCELGFYIFASLFGLSAVVAAFLPDDRLLMRPKLPAPEPPAPEPPAIEETKEEERPETRTTDL